MSSRGSFVPKRHGLSKYCCLPSHCSAKHLSRAAQLSRVGRTGAGAHEPLANWVTTRRPRLRGQGSGPPGAHQLRHDAAANNACTISVGAEPDGEAPQVIGEDAAPPPSTADCTKRKHKLQIQVAAAALTAHSSSNGPHGLLSRSCCVNPDSSRCGTSKQKGQLAATPPPTPGLHKLLLGPHGRDLDRSAPVH